MPATCTRATSASVTIGQQKIPRNSGKFPGPTVCVDAETHRNRTQSQSKRISQRQQQPTVPTPALRSKRSKRFDWHPTEKVQRAHHWSWKWVWINCPFSSIELSSVGLVNANQMASLAKHCLNSPFFAFQLLLVTYRRNTVMPSRWTTACREVSMWFFWLQTMQSHTILRTNWKLWVKFFFHLKNPINSTVI